VLSDLYKRLTVHALEVGILFPPSDLYVQWSSRKEKNKVGQSLLQDNNKGCKKKNRKIDRERL
jgi:hypothetical protein